MEIYQIVFISLYVVALVTYLFVETGANFKLRVAVKTLLATLYLATATVSTSLLGASVFRTLICFACVFAWIGDVLLLFKKTLPVGVMGFLVSNILLIGSEIYYLTLSELKFGDIWWTVIVFVVMFGALLTANFTKFIDFGKYTAPLGVYIAVMTITGSIGIGLSATATSYTAILFGVGAAMFMLSDYFLGAHMFKWKNNLTLRCNSFLYFSGIMLIALSVAF